MTADIPSQQPTSLFSLQLFFRRGPSDNVSRLARSISLRARGPREAELEAQAYLKDVDWKTQYAALFAEDERQFIRYWVKRIGDAEA